MVTSINSHVKSLHEQKLLDYAAYVYTHRDMDVPMTPRDEFMLDCCAYFHKDVEKCVTATRGAPFVKNYVVSNAIKTAIHQTESSWCIAARNYKEEWLSGAEEECINYFYGYCRERIVHVFTKKRGQRKRVSRAVRACGVRFISVSKYIERTARTLPVIPIGEITDAIIMDSAKTACSRKW